MNERTILEHRVATLDGLLDTPSGPLGPNAGELGEQLRADWSTERRLLQRLLAESRGDDVASTIAAWRGRTASFIARSGDDSPSWTDKSGASWNARHVMSLLDETQGRIDRWLGGDAQPDVNQ
ncbi:MAG: hypothetical protein ACK2T6_05420 [Anaerolineae bacterium]